MCVCVCVYFFYVSSFFQLITFLFLFCFGKRDFRYRNNIWNTLLKLANNKSVEEEEEEERPVVNSDSWNVRKEWKKRKRSRSVETLFHSSLILPEIYPSISCIYLNVGHTHTHTQTIKNKKPRKKSTRTGHILPFCWLVPLQSTHWSNSLVDAWSLDPTLQWFFVFISSSWDGRTCNSEWDNV